jgi:hypothetical protein
MELAKKHALSRRVSTERYVEGEEYHYCPCCGYQIERDDIEYNCDPIKMGYLYFIVHMNLSGSGFPLFYSFIKFCIFILF